MVSVRQFSAMFDHTLFYFYKSPKSDIGGEGGARFFFAYRFCQTTHHPTPAINNERSLSIGNSMLILWIIFQIRKGNRHDRKRENQQKIRSTREHRPPWLKQIIPPILPTVLCMMGCEAAKQQQCYYALHCLGGERLTPKVLHGSLPTPRSGHETAIMFLAHLLILKDPKQNFITIHL